ncbi:MAG: hypothetical protein HY814_04035 [Candidatus Riflebacteria bacterium]|nr:hypothetical protein [Candidatus Riflebacteria bacterium]
MTISSSEAPLCTDGCHAGVSESVRLATTESLQAAVVGPWTSFLAKPVAPLPAQAVSSPEGSASRAPGEID